MQRKSVDALIERIDNVDSYIKLFSSSLPRLKDGNADLVQAHLDVVEDCMPFLKRLIAYIAESVPLMHRMSQVVVQGTSDLSRASENLGEIDQAAERAVTEILDSLELARCELEGAGRAPDCGARTREHVDSAATHLMTMIDSLQFQDITSQRVRSTVTMLAELDRRLGSLLDEEQVPRSDLQERSEAMQGTYDAEARYDREESACQQEQIDEIMSELGSEDAGKAA